MKIVHYESDDTFVVISNEQEFFKFTLDDIKNNNVRYSRTSGKLAYYALVDWASKHPEVFI